MDQGAIDFQRLFVFTLSSAFFVVRTKSNVLIQRRYSHPVDKSTGVRLVNAQHWFGLFSRKRVTVQAGCISSEAPAIGHEVARSLYVPLNRSSSQRRSWR